MRATRIAFLLIAIAGNALAQLNSNCTVSVLNRSVQARANGSWVLPNVPANVGLVRARATCVENGVTRSGQSAYFVVPPNGVVDGAVIVFAQPEPIVASLALTSSTSTLNAVGATVQLAAIGTYANGTTRDLTSPVFGTNYFTSNARVAAVSASGLVTAQSAGTALISAMNEGALAIRQITIVLGADTDGDGMPDTFEIEHGLDPNNAADAQGDLDGDNLSNVEEFRRGTGIRDGDSDDDSLPDGDEVLRGTNPLLADTDGDGVRDALEVATSSDPLDPNSVNLAQALRAISVTPFDFEIVVNTIIGEASRRVRVTGQLRDDTTLDLTARGTSYASSNLAVASFGGVPGEIFGGSNGTAVVTITNSGFTTTARVTVRSFAPIPLAFLRVPGYANNLDVAGDYVYIAAGAAGLHVIDVRDRRAPRIVATLDTPGNANDVRVAGTIAYVADGSAGLQLIDIANPQAPRIAGSIDTPGSAWDVAVSGEVAYVADGATGLRTIDVRNPAAPRVLGSLDTAGTAKGVDVSGRYAIVADGNVTRVIDVANPAAPAAAGVALTSQAVDVAVRGTLAFVADLESSLRIVDFSNPALPRIVGSADRNLAGIVTDVANSGELVMASDILFNNGVSITDVRAPATPTVRARLDFPQRDDPGTGVAVDHQFIYLAADRGYIENGTSNDSALYIGQYLYADDTGGIAPTIRLTAPTQNAAIAGGLLRIAADASDDVLVAKVEFLVDGIVVSTDTTAPYEYTIRVPQTALSITIQARALDAAGSVATTPQLTLSVVSDPGTTATGHVLQANGTPVSGALVRCGGQDGATNAAGQFSIGSIPTTAGDIRCTANYTDGAGLPYTAESNTVTPIPAGITNVGDLRLRSALEVVQLDKSAWGVNAAFRARTVVREGGLLVVGSNGEPAGIGGSPQLVVFDLADAARPSHLRTVTAVDGAVWDFEVRDGWAYVAGHDFCTFNLIAPDIRNCDSRGFSELGVALHGTYAFTSSTSGDGRIRVYDVSVPKSPRYIREQNFVPGIMFRDLAMYGAKYLIAMSADKTSGVGHDVVVLEILDVNSIRKIADLDVPDFDALRGEIRGSMLYLAGFGTDAVLVDLTNPAQPVVAGRRNIGHAAGVFVNGNDLFAAAGNAGLVTLDVATPASPVVTRTIAMSGFANDVTAAWNYAYVANDVGLAVVGLAVAPQIDLSAIALARDGTMVRVTGSASSISGQAPLQVTLTNAATGASVGGTAVANDGSFTATLPATAGDALTIAATDSAGRTAGPVSLGIAPFGAFRFVNITAGQTDANFRARTLAADGNLLAVGPFREDFGASPRVAVFDVSNPGNPVFKHTAVAADGHAYDVELINGWAYVAGHDFCTIDLTNQAAVRKCISIGFSEIGIAVAGNYAYTSVDSGNARIRVYDVSNPSAPRWIREFSPGPNINHHDLVVYGSAYLIGISPQETSGVGHDVIVYDRRDVNALVRVADLDIPNFRGQRARIHGSLLYIASADDSTGVAIVDLTNPRAPRVLSMTETGARTRGVTATGSTAVVANGTLGVGFLDASDPSAPVLIGHQQIGGSANDVLVRRGTIYVAAENGLAVLSDASAPPVIDLNRIIVSVSTATTATVTGIAGAVTGDGALRIEVRNDVTGVRVSGLAVAADGSFSATIAARSGETLSALATDANDRTTAALLGPVPFGSTAKTVLIPPSQANNAFRARTLATEGTILAVGPWSEDFGQSPYVVVFDITDPRNPLYKHTAVAADGHVYDVEISGGWAFSAGHDFCTIDLRNATATRNCDSRGFTEFGVAVAGGIAYTSSDSSTARIRVFDVSNPAAPRIMREHNLPLAINYHDLVLYGTDHLVGISPMETTGGVGHDVVVYDRRDVNNLAKIADIDIPNFKGHRARVQGNLLYVSSWFGSSALAIVDLTNPASPRIVSVFDGGGAARGVAVAGNAAATADGSIGVTFLDVGNPAQPAITGRQFVGGNAWDALFANGALYVANEQGIVVIPDVMSGPIIDLELIAVAADSSTSAVVTGSARAITGQAPLTLVATNTNTSASSANVSVAADGSFSTSLAARAGDVIAVTVTDGAGRTAGPLTIGSVPLGAAPTTILISPAQTNSAFRARTLAAEGTILAVGPAIEDFGASPYVAVFDVTNPTPVLSHIAVAADGGVFDLEIKGGYGFVAGHDFCTIDLRVPGATRTCDSRGFSELAVAVVNGFAYTATDSSTGRIRLYDVAAPGSAPRFLREINDGRTMNFTDLIAYGTDYLVALSPDANGDVTIYDRREPHALPRIVSIDIPGMRAYRGRIDGSTLYVASWAEGTALAIVDLSNPAAPQVKNVLQTGGRTRGVTFSGTTLVTADGSAGVSLVDASNPSSPIVLGRQFVGGSAWDALLRNGTLYVANEIGLVAIPNAAVPPTIDGALLTTSSTSATTASIAGAARAIGGSGAISVEATNTSTKVTGSAVTVGANGAFIASVEAREGELVSVRATDAAGRSASLSAGAVPFGTSVAQTLIPPSQTNGAHRSRTLALGGNLLAVGSWSEDYGQSPYVVVYNVSDPANPVRSHTAVAADGHAYDMEIRGTYGFVAGHDFCSIDFAQPGAVRRCDSRGFSEYGIALSGNYAFTSTNSSDGRIRVFNISNPAAPSYVREQDTASTTIYRDVIAYGTDYLVALSPDSGHDVVVFDIRNVNNLVKVADVDIPNFRAFRGRIDGATLYVASYDSDASVAIVDLTAPSAPQVRSVLATGGLTRGVHASNDLLITADRSAGLTFIDVANPATPTILGRQPIGGSAWDVVRNGRHVYVANEIGLVTVREVE